MSQQRRERRQQRKEAQEPAATRDWKRMAIFAVIVVIAVGVGYFFYHRSQHKYDAFARCLRDRGVVMYGAWWCPHCQEQEEKFSASFEYAPYIECGIKGDIHGQNPKCKEDGIKHYPTWQFPPTGERLETVFDLWELSDRTGCPLP
jgi:hypothetical protein